MRNNMAWNKPAQGANTRFYKILDVMRDHSPMSVRDINAHSGIPVSSIRSLLTVAKKHYFVEPYGSKRGQYRITEKGIKYLEEYKNKVSICEICGNPFIPDKHHPHQKYCSKRCNQRAFYMHRREYRREYMKKYRDENREKIRALNRKSYSKNAEKNRKYKKEHYQKNKKRYQENRRKWYLRNKIKLREKWFLYGHSTPSGGHKRGFLESEGFCIICGELNPFSLEDEHVFGQKNSDFCVTLCAKCHRIRHKIRGSQGWEFLLKINKLFTE